MMFSFPEEFHRMPEEQAPEAFFAVDFVYSQKGNEAILVIHSDRQTEPWKVTMQSRQHSLDAASSDVTQLTFKQVH